MNKILVAFDFSDISENALGFGFKMAKLFHADLHIVTIMSPMEQVDNNIYNALYFPDYMEYRQQLLEDTIKKYLKKYPDLAKYVQGKVITGNIVSGIFDYIKKNKIDLLLCGSTGVNPAAEFFLGSTTASLLAKTEIPMLVVPPTSKSPSFKRVSFATDLNPTLSPVSKLFLKNVSTHFKSKVHLVNISDNEQEVPENKWKNVEELFGENKFQRHIIHSANTARAISLFIESTNSDFLITIKHKHGFFYKLLFSRMTKQLLSKFNIPVLILPE